jgi:hypothetical protein
LVLGKNGLGEWQRQVESRVQLLNFIRGQKPVIVLLLPDVEPGDSWKRYLDDQELVTVLEDRLRLPLPPVEELRKVMAGRTPTFAERLLKLVFQLIRSLDAPQN